MCKSVSNNESGVWQFITKSPHVYIINKSSKSASITLTLGCGQESSMAGLKANVNSVYLDIRGSIRLCNFSDPNLYP